MNCTPGSPSENGGASVIDLGSSNRPAPMFRQNLRATAPSSTTSGSPTPRRSTSARVGSLSGPVGRPGPVTGSNRRPAGSNPEYPNVNGGSSGVGSTPGAPAWSSIPTISTRASRDAPLNPACR